MHHLKRQNKIHDSLQEKRDLSQAMHHFHAIAPIILLLHKWHPEKGPITPSRPTPLSHHHDKFFAVLRTTPWNKGKLHHHANRSGYLFYLCTHFSEERIL